MTTVVASTPRAVSAAFRLTGGRYQPNGEGYPPTFVAEALAQETVLSVIGMARTVPAPDGGPPVLVIDREKLHAQLDRVIADVTRKWCSHGEEP